MVDLETLGCATTWQVMSYAVEQHVKIIVDGVLRNLGELNRRFRSNCEFVESTGASANFEDEIF